MLLKNIALGLLLLCLIGTSIPSEAGMFSKAAKGYVAAKAVQKFAPAIAKKIAQNKAKKVAQNGVADSTKQLTKKQTEKLAKKEKREKLAKGPLVDGELKVGKYKDVTIDRVRPANGVKNEEVALEAHHMPSKKYMKEHDVDTKDGISVDMLRARHKNTRTNGREVDLNETPREALARDVKDFKNQYRGDPDKYKKARESAKEVIKQNKEEYSQIFKK